MTWQVRINYEVVWQQTSRVVYRIQHYFLSINSVGWTQRRRNSRCTILGWPLHLSISSSVLLGSRSKVVTVDKCFILVCNGPINNNARNLHNPFPSLRKWILQDYKFSNSIHDTQIVVIGLKMQQKVCATWGSLWRWSFSSQNLILAICLSSSETIFPAPTTIPHLQHVWTSSGSSSTVRIYCFSSTASELSLHTEEWVALKCGQLCTWKHHKWNCL